MRSYVKCLEGLQKVICMANTTAVYVDMATIIVLTYKLTYLHKGNFSLVTLAPN